MITTTSYGTYVNATPGSYAINLETAILDAFGSEGPDGYDTDAITAAMRDRINEILDGTGISLHGDEFYGPWEPTDAQATAMAAVLQQADSQIDSDDPTATMVAVALAWADFWTIAEQHETRR